MDLTIEKAKEIALAIVKDDISGMIDGKPLSKEDAEMTVLDIIESNISLPGIFITREEMLQFYHLIIPGEKNKTTFMEAVQKLT